MMNTALEDFGTWSVGECDTKDCWCRMIITDTNMYLDKTDTSRVPTDGSDDMEFCIIPAGALPAKYANLVAASPKMLYSLEATRERIMDLDPDILFRFSILRELLEIIEPVITEARRKI